MPRFKCTNFGQCAKADAQEIIDVAPGAEPFCPECEKTLVAAKGTTGSGGSPLLKIAIPVAVLALAGLVWFLTRPPKQDEPGPPSDKPAATVAIRLAGSNTVAKAAVILAESYTGGQAVSNAANSWTVTGNGKTIEIKGDGSSTGFTALGGSAADIAMASRRIRPEEAESLKALGDLTANESEQVIGLDTVTAIVHPENPIGSITEEMASRIITGAMAQWPGGNAIQVYTRDANSATRDFASRGKPFAASAKAVASNAALDDAVAADPAGIAFVSRAFAKKSKTVPLTAFSELRAETEADPWTRRLYFYVPGSASAAAKAFAEFARSKPSQELLAKSGFVGQTPEVVPPPPLPTNPPPPPEYAGVSSSADRVTIDLRFRHGSSELDSKAIDDIGRIIEILKDPKYRGRHVVLIGFADSSGSPAANVVLSKDRAASVAAELKRRNVEPAVITGFGQAMPVAPNDTEEGRQKNRRVEVWLRK